MAAQHPLAKRGKEVDHLKNYCSSPSIMMLAEVQS
jgi:hypothetical protein